ncbi:MAG: histidine phosphatase family protein [Ruminococcus sp.]|nr:histidine phosphatase family protein [Ruminococcus sp.]
MKILFIRHGLTAGNLEKRYIGSTDEPLCDEGVSQLRTLNIISCDTVICSPMKRCIQTAEILFPNSEYQISDGLRECDFGDFEGRNYMELSDNADYQKWIDSGGTLPFPNGEAPADFRRRCAEAFETAVKANAGADSIAFVVHGGTIMSILERYAVPHRDYFDFHCENAHGYVCRWNGSEIIITETI